jgi:hypothetical protein
MINQPLQQSQHQLHCGGGSLTTPTVPLIVLQYSLRMAIGDRSWKLWVTNISIPYTVGFADNGKK